MKTNVVLTSFIDGKDRYIRHKRWIKYMDKEIKHRLKYDKIIFLDNATDLKYLKKLDITVLDQDMNFVSAGRTDLIAIRFNEHLPRKAILDYPYHWRAFYHIPELQHSFLESDKYYWIDSDLYIQTQEIIDYMKNLKSGLTAFYDVVNQFPESMYFTACKDSFNSIYEDSKKGFMNRAGLLAETQMPWTHVEKKFYGGRLPEKGITSEKAHYVGQVGKGYKIGFRE